jgi:hypothetical protein
MESLWNHPAGLAHAEILARSFQHFLGKPLLVPSPRSDSERARTLFEAPFVLVSHDSQPDPLLTYGNARALALWEMPWERFTQTPSRLTAEAPLREERARLLAQVTKRGFIEDYSGIRISASGARFRIHQATVWNLLTPAGQPCGQAACFSQWTPL